MLWLNLELRLLQNKAFATAETVDVGTWLRLMNYCCSQENSGLIRDAKTWSERAWMLTFGLQKAEVERKCDLWSWRENHLRVNFFPVHSLDHVKRLRAQASKAGKTRWEKAHATRQTGDIPSGIDRMPSGTADDATRNGPVYAKGKVREGKVKKGKGREASPADDGQRPRALADVISFFATLSAPPEVATKFFHHYNANGWLQGGRTPIASWRSQGEKWIGDWRDERPSTAQKSAGEGAPPPGYDASQPHASTGGIALAN